MERDIFVIGDVHGRFDELERLFNKVDTKRTRVILVGDLIDRGPKGRKVIDFVRRNNLECVLGNHEIMLIEQKYMIKNLADIDKSNLSPEEKREEMDFVKIGISASGWYRNGGWAVMKESEGDWEGLLEDIEFLETLPLYIETGVFNGEGKEALITHSCVLDIIGEATNAEKLERHFEEVVWGRKLPKDVNIDSPKYFNIFGHTPTDVFSKNEDPKLTKDGPYINEKKHMANVDTGACYEKQARGILSGVHFPSLEVKTVKTVFPI